MVVVVQTDPANDEPVPDAPNADIAVADIEPVPDAPNTDLADIESVPDTPNTDLVDIEPIPDTPNIEDSVLSDKSAEIVRGKYLVRQNFANSGSAVPHFP